MSLKKTFYQTTYTEIPAHIPRQLAVDLLHNHSEIIELNPLVIGHNAIKAPQKAPADEYYSTWYEINQRIQYIPGTGKMGSGKISFNGVFHDLPTGVQTHVYAAGGVDLRHNYNIGGNQPGETPEAKDLGSGAPSSGLYLKEDVEIKCNMMLLGFVKKELRSSTDVLLARLVKKAELIDAGVLHAMMEDGKLKTVNPAQRASTYGPLSPALSPGFPPSNRASVLPYSSPRLPDEVQPVAELPDTDSNLRQSTYGSHLAPQGLGVELPADHSYPVESPTNSQPSMSQPSTDRTSYHELSSESSATAHHELPAEQSASEWKSSDQLPQRYYASDRSGQSARRSSWTPDDDKLNQL